MALDQVARREPALPALPAGVAALLPGTLTALFDLRSQQFVRVDHRIDVVQNEKGLARTMVAALPRGSLILADLGYFAFAWFDDLTAASHWWLSRLRACGPRPATPCSTSSLSPRTCGMGWSGWGGTGPTAPRTRCGWSASPSAGPPGPT